MRQIKNRNQNKNISVQQSQASELGHDAIVTTDGILFKMYDNNILFCSESTADGSIHSTFRRKKL